MKISDFFEYGDICKYPGEIKFLEREFYNIPLRTLLILIEGFENHHFPVDSIELRHPLERMTDKN